MHMHRKWRTLPLKLKFPLLTSATYLYYFPTPRASCPIHDSVRNIAQSISSSVVVKCTVAINICSLVVSIMVVCFRESRSLCTRLCCLFSHAMKSLGEPGWRTLSQQHLYNLSTFCFCLNVISPPSLMFWLGSILFRCTVHPAGCGWSGQDSATLATLLHRDSGAHLRCRLCR